MTLTESLRQLLSKPLVWALIFLALVAYGVYALFNIPVEVLPRFNYPQIAVIVHNPGATAEELESLITRPIEGQVMALPGLINVRSTMGNGTVEIDARFARGTDAQQDLQAVNGAIDRARGDLPASAHPYAEIMGNAINEVADYAVSIPANVSPVAVQRIIRSSIQPALRAVPGVQRVEVYGVGREAIWVQPNLQALKRYDVPILAITAALRKHVLLKPGGYIHQGHQHVLIEVRSLPTTIAAVEAIPVASPSGPVPLRNLSRVVRTSVPVHNAIYLDGRPSVALTILKQPGASTLPVTRAVQAALDGLSGQLPHGVKWVRIYSQGHLVHRVGADLGRNLVVGATFAILALFWILGAGRGIWVLALSIPLSLLVGIAGLFAVGQTLNLMTLGALTVVVGLLADEAIIVLEAIYRRWEDGEARWEGIQNGLRDIASPDVSGGLANVSVFAPLLFVGGLAGLFFIPFALAMALAILASLLISLTFIPLGLGFIRARPRGKPTLGGRVLDRLLHANDRLFRLVSRYPRWSLCFCVMLLIGSLCGLALLPVNFLPLPNEGVMLDSFTLPPGTSLRETEATVASITRKFRKDPAVLHTYARIGSARGTGYTEAAYAGEIQIVLKPGVSVNSLNRIGNQLLRDGHTTAVQMSIDTPTIERLGESLSGLPQPFVLHVFGYKIKELRKLSKKIVTRLHKVPQLTDIFNNDAYPVTQLRIVPRPDIGAIDGMTPGGLYDQIKPLLAGEVVARVPQGIVPIDLYVRPLDVPGLTANALRAVPISLGRDNWTPLGQMAKIQFVTAPNRLRHIDGARALDILATPTGPLGAAVNGARHALKGLRLPPGYRISFGGLYRQLEQAAMSIGLATAAAFILMFGILALQFDGMLAPGLLVLQIPLAFTGGALALVVSGVGLNATALVAFLSLVGLSLNHGIVLLYRVRRNEADGMEVGQAVQEAVHVRFRPILLTTLTAVLGMLPTATGWGQGAAPEQGLAVVILGGILWSAMLTTNLIPALYLHWHRHPRSVRGELRG